jgi:hypothetical protein
MVETIVVSVYNEIVATMKAFTCLTQQRLTGFVKGRDEYNDCMYALFRT